MAPAPLISIVVPVFNDESTVAAALESCLAQTAPAIEVICVDDASTDRTAEVIAGIARRDPRVRLVEHTANSSAFRARRTGIDHARADYVLFLDGDDELVPDAAQKLLAHVSATGADLICFGVQVVDRHGHTGGSYEGRLQPAHRSLVGAEVLSGLFPVGTPAQGQLWRYLFRTGVLRDAYALMPEGLSLRRVNDLPIMFLVAALAGSFASIDDKLYRYHFGRGGSGHRVDSPERAEFYASAIDSIESIRDAVTTLESRVPLPQLLRETYDSARLSIIGYVCFQLIHNSDPAVLSAALAHLSAKASWTDIVRGAARFYPTTVKALRFHAPHQPLPANPRSILLATSTLRTGGVSAVLAAQASYLSAAGYRVTIVARSGGSDPAAVPSDVAFVELTGGTQTERYANWAALCRQHEVDVVIDHQILYTDAWPEFALMARSEGATTIGWLHNFVARPIYDGTDRLSLIERCADTLGHLVTLSPLDRAYFDLRGVTHTSFLPNPPSPLLLDARDRNPRTQAPSGPIRLVWWGRLEEHTKKVRQLIEVGVQLRKLGVDFRLSVIGPDWDDMTARRFNAEARRRGVGALVEAVGARRGARLVEAIDSADLFVSTSIIEGYQLTIAEAQSRGLPVVMFDLPWLTLVQGNTGLATVAQGDAAAMSAEIAAIARDPERYLRMSQDAVVAARRATSFDFAALYRGVITGSLPAEFSPEPTLADASELLGLFVFYAEKARERFRTPATASAFSAGAWQRLAPAGRSLLNRVPGLRPLAHRIKRRLGLTG